MEQIRISGKNLGELETANFCPTCFWLKLHCNYKLPFQIFPGIFSSIDSYSKKITNFHFEHHGHVPKWFSDFGSLGHPVKVPGYSKFSVIDSKNNILLTGVPDEIFQKDDNSYFIADYKTAKFTNTQDELLPMYRVQLNAYAYIAERVGYKPISGLGLVYYEPFTDISAGNVKSFTMENGFSMHFSGKLLPIELNPGSIVPLLTRVREIYEQPNPPTMAGCKNCETLEILISTLTTGQ